MDDDAVAVLVGIVFQILFGVWGFWRTDSDDQLAPMKLTEDERLRTSRADRARMVSSLHGALPIVRRRAIGSWLGAVVTAAVAAIAASVIGFSTGPVVLVVLSLCSIVLAVHTTNVVRRVQAADESLRASLGTRRDLAGSPDEGTQPPAT